MTGNSDERDKAGGGKAPAPRAALFDDESIRLLDAQYTPVPDFEAWSAGLVVDVVAWSAEVAKLDELAGRPQGEALAHSLTVAMRAAAVDTGALEGLYATTTNLTRSIALQEAGWLEQMRSQDETMLDFFEAHMRAYEAAGAIAASDEPVTEAWLRSLHEVVTAPQATYKARTAVGWQDLPLPRGQYKQHSNHGLVAPGEYHPFAPPAAVPDEMHRFVQSLNSPALLQGHPVVQAAYAHYGFVWIHPFADGNGRVARALASVFLRRVARISLVIWNDQREEYHRALAAADAGDRQALVDFVADRALETMVIVVNTAEAALEDEAADLSALLTSHGGLSHVELDTIATRIRATVGTRASATLSALGLPAGVSVATGLGVPALSLPSGYRPGVADNQSAYLQIHSGPPAGVSVGIDLCVLIATDDTNRRPFRIEATNTSEPLDVTLTAVHPRESAAFTATLEAWLRRVLTAAMRQLARETEEKLKSLGYKPSL